MRLLHDSIHRFSHISPIYNWIYPIAGRRRAAHYSGDLAALLGPARRPTTRPRALYLHTPFCDTICSFCPLVKGPLTDSDALNLYVRAVLAEIALKGRDRELTRLPIRAIFFGGGTPSLLPPEHIRQIGAALRAAFDLTPLEEFSVEMEAKSITPERIDAFRAIGATHARFGAQTFSQRHRATLGLTATPAQLELAAQRLKATFPHASCDMLYGLHGQTGDEFVADIDAATALGLDNIDFYPLNIFVVQKKLHRGYRHAGLAPASGLSKLYMTQALRQIMRGKGYLPHNGHGFVRVPPAEAAANPVVTRRYAFKYHQHVYGAADDEYIGIGNSALSYIGGRTVGNEMSRQRYVDALLRQGSVPVSIVDHSPQVNAGKIVAISLPYLGHAAIDRIRWDDLPAETAALIAQAIDNGLIERDAHELRLTHEGWLWYVSLMFYLAPRDEQAAVAAIMMRDASGAYVSTQDIERLTAAG